MITLTTIRTEARRNPEGLVDWLAENAEAVAAAFGVRVDALAMAVDAVPSHNLAKAIVQTCTDHMTRAGSSARDLAIKAMQVAVDAAAAGPVLDARALLDAITSAPPGAVLVCGLDDAHEIPLRLLHKVRALKRLRGADLRGWVDAKGLHFRWYRPEGTAGGLTLIEPTGRYVTRNRREVWEPTKRDPAGPKLRLPLTE
jgi:hypothetical protein